MNFFPKQTELYEKIFEVSSTYFESSVASYRANALLKIAKIIIVLPDPVQRAYLHYMVRYCMHYVCRIWLMILLKMAVRAAMHPNAPHFYYL